jgi:SNF2 family DNA or RNA helicase
VSTPTLAISLSESGSNVEIRRDAEFDDATWLQVRAAWNADGRDADRLIEVRLEQFMAQRNAFAARARTLGVDAAIDEGVMSAVRRAKQTRLELEESLRVAEPFSHAEVLEAIGGSRFKRDLRPFQTRDLGKLLALAHGANFSVPGAGKTAVAYAVYEAERTRGRVDRLLVIAPLSAFDAWIEEAKESLDNPPVPLRYRGGRVPDGAEVVVANYHRAGSIELADWVRRHKAMVVLDEAHRMKKGWRGEWGAACLNLAYLATRRDILTGTPAPQSPTDLVALVDFLWPNEAIRILPRAALLSNPPADAGKQVADAIRPLFARTTKADLGLPPVIKKSIIVPLEGLQADIYDAMRDTYRGTVEMALHEQHDMLRLGRITMYLLEAATNPKLLASGSDSGDPEVFRHPPLEVEPGSRLADLIETYNIHETPPKFIELLKLLKANATLGRKTLVWTNFTRNLKVLKKMLARYQPAIYHGGIIPWSNDAAVLTRETETRRFRDDPSCLVLLANPAAMSEGVSLHHECHDAIYLERTFNAGQYLQSIDRIHRLGLEPDQETRITFLLTADTIDGVVDGRVRVKAERLAEMLDDPNLATVALPDDEDVGPPIDDGEDITALFAHLRGEHAP